MKDTIEKRVTENYLANLAYFQEKHPGLHVKLMAFESAVAHGHYKPRYELEYMEEGYFDVFEPETRKWLYGSDSREHARLAAESVDYKKEGNLLETFYHREIPENDLPFYEKMKPTESSLATTAAIIHYVDKFADKKKTMMKKIYKFIFLGVGLGNHIVKIDEKIDSDVYLIVEDDLELFRLSMYVTNYADLAKRGKALIFSIMDDVKEFKRHVQRFLDTRFVYNHYLKFFHLLSHDVSKLKNIQEVIASQDYMVFNHAAILSQSLRTLEHLERDRKILDISKPLLREILKRKPVMVLGAGPSLHKNLPWLKKNQDRFVIIAVSALMPLLESEGIVPDILTHSHGFDDAMKHLDNVDDMSFFDETLAVFNAFTPLKFADRFKNENLFLYQGISEIIQGYGTLTASNIGGLSAALFLKLGVEEMYLLGLDFALDQESGATHVAQHSYSRRVDLGHEAALEDAVTTDKTIWVPGNLLDEVATTLLFNRFLDETSQLFRLLKREGQRIYNLGNGAKIAETEPLDIKDLRLDAKMPEKRDVRRKMRTVFAGNARSTLRQQDIEGVEERIEYVRKLEESIERYRKEKHGTIEQYHYDLLELFKKMLAEKSGEHTIDVDMMFRYYLKTVSGYVFDFVNTRELDNIKRHMKTFDRILTGQMEKLTLFYKGRLEDFLRKKAAPEEASGA